MSRPVLLGLVGLGAVLCGTIALELSRISKDDGGMIAAAVRPSSARPGSATAPLEMADGREALVGGILARPLFAPTRRPPTVAARVQGAPAPLPRLAGVLVNGDRRSAIFAGAEGGRPVVAGVGAEVSGYTVQAIEAGRVTLSGPGGTQTLRPSFDGRPQPAPGAAPNSAPVAGSPFPFAAATEVMPSLRGLPGFSGGAPGLAR